jgi:hypothetical protein
MPKPPKVKDQPCDREDLRKAPEKTWEEDQKERGYYYDDSHGYEVYNPDEEERETDGSL